MSDVVIHVENLGKRYKIGERERYLAMRDILARAASAPLRLFRGRNHSSANGDPTHIWAIKEVSFDVRPGEVVGIIGRNGAGKTTLLKILARVVKPTAGFADIRGRMGSLLEVGTGFHPELTGRENTFLSGAILGMSNVEIRRKFDEIVAFAEVEKFIDTPIKHFSTGMQMRLAFAVAAHLEPEILLVDEVLAVGDVSFQRKCLGKMTSVARAGRTILFVSHNMGAVARLCGRTIWLNRGGIVADGPSNEVMSQYQTDQVGPSATWTRSPGADFQGEVSFLEANIVDGEGMPKVVFSGDDEITFIIRYTVAKYLGACAIGVRICSYDGTAILTTGDADGTGYSALPKEQGCYTAQFHVSKGLLAPGSYSVLLAAHIPGRHVYDQIEQAATFEVANVGSLASIDGRLGVITPLFIWETKKERSGNGSAPTHLASPSVD